VAVGIYNTDPEMIENDIVVRQAWERAFVYAGLLRTALADYPAHVAREIKKSQLSEVEYAKARQVSKTHNLERYTVCIASLLVVVY
jgi:hypothetical protein